MKPWYLASENIKNIPITQYVASWYVGGGKGSIHQIRKWLKTLIIDGEHLTDEEIELIAKCAANGKLELQESVKRFLK